MKTLIRTTYDFLNEHIILWTILASLPAIYFTLVNFYGQDFKLTTSQITLSQRGNWLTIIILGFSIALIIIKGLSDKYDVRIRKNGMEIVKKIVDCTNSARKQKMDYYVNFIVDEEKKSICKYMGPLQQLKKVIEYINCTVADVVGLEANEVGVFILYKLPNDRDFSIICTSNCHNIRRNVKELSSLIPQEIKNGKMQIIKHVNDSEKTIGKWYQLNNVVSFYCGNVSTELRDRLALEAYTFVTTEKFPICVVSDRDARMKFKKIIMPTFDLQVNIELLKYYIHKIDKCNLKVKT